MSRNSLGRRSVGVMLLLGAVGVSAVEGVRYWGGALRQPIIEILPPAPLDVGTAAPGGTPVTQIFEISNSTSAVDDLVVSSLIVAVNGTMFAATPSMTLPATLSPGNILTVTVEFHPPAGTPDGLQNGRIDIRHNSPVPNTLTQYAIQGTVTTPPPPAPALSFSPPPPLNLGNAPAGGPAVTRTFDIVNSGTADLIVTGVAVAVNPMFSVTLGASLPATVLPSGALTVTVRFQPPGGTAAGLQTGRIDVTHNAPTAGTVTGYAVEGSVVPGAPALLLTPASPLSFGDVLPGSISSRILRIENTGASPLTFSITVPPATTAMYSVGVPSVSSLNPTQFEEITISFQPPSGTAPGVQNATISITHNDPAQASPVVYSLTGNVGAVPDLDLVPTSISLGTVVAGSTSFPRSFDIVNSGTGTLTYTVNALPAGSPFTVTPALPISGTIVSGGASVTLTVVFAPPAATPPGTQTATVQVVHDDPSQPTPAGVVLTGEVIAATRIIGYSPASFDFGPVDVGGALAATITVSNSGNSVLNVTAVTSSDPVRFVPNDPASGPVVPIPFTVDPSATRDVTVTFKPTAGGLRTATLSFSSDTTSPAPPPVSLSGTGSALPADAFLVLDKSGSMNGPAGVGVTKIARLRSAANLFVDLAPVTRGDKLGVVKFATTADYVAHLTTITAANRQTTYKDPITALTAFGSTAIGQGLQLAFNELTSGTISTNPRRVIVLITDGMENRSPYVDPTRSPTLVIPSTPAIAIYCVGVGTGSNFNAALLSDLAFRGTGSTEGYFHLTDTNDLALHKFFTSIYGDTFEDYIATDPVYSMGPGESVSQSTSIVGSDRAATFVAFWTNPGSKMALQLVAPDGTTIGPDTAAQHGMQYVAGDLYAFYRASFLPDRPWAAKKKGIWKLKLTAQQIPAAVTRESSSISVLTTSDLSFRPFLNRGVYSTGDTILLSTRLLERGRPVPADSVRVQVRLPSHGLGNILATRPVSAKALAVPRGLPDPVTNVRYRKVQVLEQQLRMPLLQYRDDSIPLFDDGMHGDGAAGDGVWANFYPGTQVEGVYTFRFLASSRTFQGERTTREKTLSTVVEVRKIDPVKSGIRAIAVAPTLRGTKAYRVTMVPRDTFGNYLGPGYADTVKVQVDGAKLVGSVQDDASGGYSLPLEVAAQADPRKQKVALKVAGSTLSFTVAELLERKGEVSTPGSSGAPQPGSVPPPPSPAWLWLILLAVIVLMGVAMRRSKA